MVNSHCCALIKNRPGIPCAFRIYHSMNCGSRSNSCKTTREHSKQKFEKSKIKTVSCKFA